MKGYNNFKISEISYESLLRVVGGQGSQGPGSQPEVAHTERDAGMCEDIDNPTGPEINDCLKDTGVWQDC